MPHPILQDAYELELEAQESWPQLIKLYQPHEVEQILLPDNANCLAVQAFFRMCNLEYQIIPRKNAEYMSPSGRVPLIQCGAFLISDFDNIVSFIDNKGTSLTSELLQEEKSDMRAYMSLINNGLANAEQYICWVDPSTLEITKRRHGSVYPWPLNHILNWQKRRQVIKKLQVLSLYSKTLDEIYEDVRICCSALSKRLEDKPYFYGVKPCELDSLFFGHFDAILTIPWPSPRVQQLASIIQSFDNLAQLYKTIESIFFPTRLFDDYFKQYASIVFNRNWSTSSSISNDSFDFKTFYYGTN